MRITTMKLSEINPAAYNPRQTLKPGEPEYEALKNGVDRFGLVVPLIVNKSTGNLISGHQRLNVLKASGAEEAEAVIVEMDAQQEKLLNVALNKIDGDWDYQKLADLFEEIEADDVKFTGFSAGDLSTLFGEETEEITYTEPEEVQKTQKKEFLIYMSFPSRELAEEWLEAEGLAARYRAGNMNLNIRMEGTEYAEGS